MELKSKLIVVLIIHLLAATAAFGQKGDDNKFEKRKPVERSPTEEQLSKRYKEREKAKATAPRTGPTFFLSPIEEGPGRFSLLISDGAGRTVSEAFVASQLALFEVVMQEAKAFAQSDEGVGVSKPQITRFYDKNEPSFLIEVAKVGDRSQFYITVKSLTGQITVDGGTISRRDPSPKGFFFEILQRLREVKAKDKSS
jgi:hypothetical protein